MLQERIRQLRKQLKLSQSDFAKGLGVTRDIISNYENGRVAPKENFLLLVCRMYNVREQWLREGEGDMLADGQSPGLIEEAVEMLRALNPKMKHYAVKLIRDLLEIQNSDGPKAES